MRKLIIGATTYYPDSPEGLSRQMQATDQVLISWRVGLEYDGEVELAVVDDCSPLPWEPPSTVDRFIRSDERGGVGQSLNRLFDMAAEQDAILLYAVDDWFVKQPYELTKWVALMERTGAIQVRLGPPHPNLHGVVRHYDGTWAIELDRNGQWGYVASHRPTLFDARKWQGLYGWWEERVNAYDCERIMNERIHKTPNDGALHLLAYEHPWEHLASIELGDIAP